MPTSFHWRCEEKNKTTTLSAVCLMLRPFMAGGGFPHKSVPISGQTGREGRRSWGRHGEGEAEDEERGTKRGEGGGGGVIWSHFSAV